MSAPDGMFQKYTFWSQMLGVEPDFLRLRNILLFVATTFFLTFSLERFSFIKHLFITKLNDADFLSPSN